MRRVSSYGAAVVVAALAGVLLTAAPAAAHTSLTAAVPGKDSTVASPAQIKLTFADPVRFPGVVVLDTKGGHHESGRPKAVDNQVTQQVAGALPPGVYRVGWRVVAPDGHPVTGDYRFTVKGSEAARSRASATPATPGPATPAATSPAAQPAKPPSSAGWWWAGLVLVVLAGGGGGLALLRRRR
jgi:methionine-rich copper-binding protein CopC